MTRRVLACSVIMELSLLMENLKGRFDQRRFKASATNKRRHCKTITLLMTHAAEPMPLYSSVYLLYQTTYLYLYLLSCNARGVPLGSSGYDFAAFFLATLYYGVLHHQPQEYTNYSTFQSHTTDDRTWKH